MKRMREEDNDQVMHQCSHENQAVVMQRYSDEGEAPVMP